MFKNNIISFGVFIFAFLISCSKDNDNFDIITVAPIDPAVQAQLDDEILVRFLQTHFYNREDFDNPPSGFDFIVRIDTISGENSAETPLFNQVITKSIEEDGVQHKYYVLLAKEGLGSRPTFIDSTLVNFRGSLLTGDVFDSSVTPLWFDLASVVRGFGLVMPELKTSDNFRLNEDGTLSFDNFGVGTVFMPSGLGFKNIPQSGIPPNSPLIFSIQLFFKIEADHDQDGIPSFMEDLNQNLNILDDDTNGNGLPDFSDFDDDGDFILTIDEITINTDGTVTFTDCDGDGVPDYLDKDICPN